MFAAEGVSFLGGRGWVEERTSQAAGSKVFFVTATQVRWPSLKIGSELRLLSARVSAVSPPDQRSPWRARPTKPSVEEKKRMEDR